MGSGKKGLYSKTRGSLTDIETTVSDLAANKNKQNNFAKANKTINKEKQEKHVPGSKYFKKGKSKLSISISHAQALVNKFAGHGQRINDHKERVDFHEVIGTYVDSETGNEKSTTIGIIHYSKTGTHIVPASPKGNSNEKE